MKEEKKKKKLLGSGLITALQEEKYEKEPQTFWMSA